MLKRRFVSQTSLRRTKETTNKQLSRDRWPSQCYQILSLILRAIITAVYIAMELIEMLAMLSISWRARCLNIQIKLGHRDLCNLDLSCLNLLLHTRTSCKSMWSTSRRVMWSVLYFLLSKATCFSRIAPQRNISNTIVAYSAWCNPSTAKQWISILSCTTTLQKILNQKPDQPKWIQDNLRSSPYWTTSSSLLCLKNQWKLMLLAWISFMKFSVMRM